MHHQPPSRGARVESKYSPRDGNQRAAYKADPIRPVRLRWASADGTLHRDRRTALKHAAGVPPTLVDSYQHDGQSSAPVAG